MIDPETGWFEIIEYNYRYAYTIENLLDQSWLRIYPFPTIIMYDHRNGFLSHALINDLTIKEYGIRAKCTTTENKKDN